MKPKSIVNLVVLLGMLIFSFGVPPAAQADTVIHVKPDGSTSWPCGDTWGNACELQTALTSASAGDEIWAAAGTYKPGTDREDSFQLVGGVALYGGFAGTETAREERDWEANLTVLSGDIGVEGNNSDNSYHVVSSSGVDASTILDGFTVEKGNANGNDPWDRGGGMYNQSSSPTLTNLIFINNRADFVAGGVYNVDSSPTLSNVTFSYNAAGYCGGLYNRSDSDDDSSSTLTNVTFSSNTAFGDGGGMCNTSSNPILTDVTFSGNHAYSGGGIYNEFDSDPILTDVTFSGNHAVGGGGGMTNFVSNPSLTSVIFSGNTADGSSGGINNFESSPTLTNVTFSGNTAGTSGGGILNQYNSSPTLTNVILWGNSPDQIYNYESSPIVSYSAVQGGYSGTANIDQDPLFVRNPSPGADGTWGTPDDDYGDLRLGNGSPAIDAGDNTAPGLTGITTDLDGNPRFDDIPGIADTGVGPAPVVDIGAYEAINIAPAAADDSFTTDENVSLNVPALGVLINDSDPNGDPLSVEQVSGPGSGSLTLNPDGSFDYLPEADYNGEVSFTYHATDGLLNSNTATVTITINEVEIPLYLPAISKADE